MIITNDVLESNTAAAAAATAATVATAAVAAGLMVTRSVRDV